MSWQWLWIACGTFTLDILWALYTRAISSRQPLFAGAIAAFLYIVGGGLVTAYVNDHWLLIPAALGAFGGTYAGTRWGPK